MLSWTNKAFESLSGNTFTLLCVTTVLLYLYLSTRRPKNFPPGPISFPFVGAVPFLSRRPEENFANWRKKYGDIIGLKLGKDYTVVLNNYELIQEALVKNGTIFSHRPDNFIMTEVFHKCGLSMSDYTGNYIKERKFAYAALGRLGLGKRSLEMIIISEAREFSKYLATTNGHLDEPDKRMLMNAAANVISSIVLGKTYDYQDPEFMSISEGIINFFRRGSLAYQMTILLPWSHHIPPVRGSANAIRAGFASLDEIMDRKLEEHEATFDPENIRDFFDEYLVQMRQYGNEENGIFTRKMLRCMARDLYTGSMETLLITLFYLLIAVTNRPEIQQKIHDEIDEVLGSEGLPAYATKEKMPFLMATIRESLRWRTLGPVLIAHSVAEDVVFHGYNIPKDTAVLPNVYAVHNDPEIWENPKEFIPERHLDDNGQLIVSKYVMPFGIGPRMCIGRKLAEVELFTFFTSILQKYKLIPTPTKDCDRPWVPEEVEYTGLVIALAETIPISFIPR